VLWGIPTCGTVKKAERWLTDAGHPYTTRDLRRDPPTRDSIAAAVAALGARALRNTSGASFRALPPAREQWTDAQWIDAFTADPMLIRRPVVWVDGVARFAGWPTDPAAALAG
jgi:arsenate reductase